MKRMLLILCILVSAAAATAGADGLRGSRLGLEFGNPSAVIIYRPSNFDFKLGYNFASGSEFLFLSADYRIISGYQLVDFVHFFLGVGGYGAFYSADRGGGDGQIDIGARIPVGLQAFLFGPTVELFLEVAPTVLFFPSIDAFNEFQGWVGFTILIK